MAPLTVCDIMKYTPQKCHFRPPDYPPTALISVSRTRKWAAGRCQPAVSVAGHTTQNDPFWPKMAKISKKPTTDTVARGVKSGKPQKTPTETAGWQRWDTWNPGLVDDFLSFWRISMLDLTPLTVVDQLSLCTFFGVPQNRPIPNDPLGVKMTLRGQIWASPKGI